MTDRIEGTSGDALNKFEDLLGESIEPYPSRSDAPVLYVARHVQPSAWRNIAQRHCYRAGETAQTTTRILQKWQAAIQSCVSSVCNCAHDWLSSAKWLDGANGQ